MILGLDISTSITGYTIVDGEKVVENGAWDTRKYKDFFDKVEHVKAKVDEVHKKIQKQNHSNLHRAIAPII